MQLKNVRGSVAVEEVLLSVIMVLTLGGTFTALSTGANDQVQRIQATYSGHQLQPLPNNSRAEFLLVTIRSAGSAMQLEIPETDGEPPSTPANSLTMTLSEHEALKGEFDDQKNTLLDGHFEDLRHGLSVADFQGSGEL